MSSRRDDVLGQDHPERAAERERPRQVIAYMAVSRWGTARFTDNPDAARELEGYGWAITPLVDAGPNATGKPPESRPGGLASADGLGLAVNRALFAADCQRLSEWALIGPVQRAAVESFAEHLLAAERERWRALLDELSHIAEKGEMPDGDYCSVTVAMWAEDWLRKLRA